MTARSQITVTVANVVADRYRRPDEKIIEFDSPNGGGLIAFRMMDDGTLRVEPYRLDGTVDINLPPDAYRFYALRTTDVGSSTLQAFGRSWQVSNFMGAITSSDIGRRVYCVTDPGSQRGPGASPDTVRYLLQVENDEQRNRRTGRG